MVHDSDYFRQREAEARALCRRDELEESEVAGHLALAYAALARREAAMAQAEESADA